MNQVEVIELAGRVSSEMSVGSLVFYGILFPVGLVIACNIAQMADRVFLFLVDVVPGPVERASPRSIRFAAGVIAFLSLIGLVVEMSMGLT
ncbi:hypothetical protein [Streptomyces prasinopilosus]|uniref:Uncharacterized protein n=1 Tax=Streptomyces prasinopilosus TaxID=67344 RepID=A0A1G7BBK9_9ACTN|nr:hypothetical protein [Streptomyces prasinopilosus]SDE24352.1 hypothetical protein SAMN05216505_12233 [Streptomyces prasinopilosus]